MSTARGTGNNTPRQFKKYLNILRGRMGCNHGREVLDTKVDFMAEYFHRAMMYLLVCSFCELGERVPYCITNQGCGDSNRWEPLL